MKKLVLVLSLFVLCFNTLKAQYYPIQKGDKWSFIDTNGKEIIPPIYTNAKPFSEGLAAVSVSREGEFEKWYYISDSFKIKIKFGYADAMTFKDGIAPVKTFGGWNYIDSDGNMIIKGDYDSALHFNNGYARVLKNGLWALIDDQGRYIKNPNFTGLTDYTERFLGVKHKDAKYWYYTALSGDTVISDTFIEARNFIGGWAPVKQNHHWFYINNQGKKMLDPYVDDAYPFYGRFASVKENGRWYLMDKQGRVYRDLEIITPVNFIQALTWVELASGKKGYMNQNGNWIYTQ